MRLLELGTLGAVGFSFCSLLLGLVIIHCDLEGEPPWTQVTDKDVGGSQRFGAITAPVKNVTDAPLISTPLSTRFFPTYGTNEFYEKCGWAMKKIEENKDSDCTFLVRPPPDTAEGISHWIPQIVAGHLFTLQTGCRLYFDYGPGIDLHRVLIPFSSLAGNTYRPINWTVPAEFVCHNETRTSACFLPRPSYAGIKQLEYYEDTLNKSLSPVPDYRFAYKYSRDFFENKQGSFQEIQLSLSGLHLETAMACSLGSLFQLSPNITQFQPDLFSKILPTLHQDGTFVMALYIRTGHADTMAKKEKEGKKAAEASQGGKLLAQKVITCALGLEQEYLANSTSYSRIVWFVASDSPFVKRWVAENYDSRHVNTTIPREVVSTTSRGVHSRASRDPSTRDFAEAFVDWYLIGESDLVIEDQIMAPSFADTASLRTARPIYKVHGKPPVCERAKLFDAIKM